MKHFGAFIISLVVIALSATISWIAWNDVSYLFPLPPKWMHLDWRTAFCLVWLVRTLSSVMRYQDIKALDSK